MNEREWQFLSSEERDMRDGSALPTRYLLKALAIKMRRRLWGWYVDRGRRIVWMPFSTTESDGPGLAIRTYDEHAAIRKVLAGIHSLRRACELGCGYGRMTIVLQEFATIVKGFEREGHLVDTARALVSRIEFQQVTDLTAVEDPEPYDLVMTFTVLQHLTDADAQRVCGKMTQLAPKGYVLIVEKTAPTDVTVESTDGRRFISRSRPIATYEEYLQPFRLISAVPRPARPASEVSAAGHLMLFAAPDARHA